MDTNQLAGPAVSTRRAALCELFLLAVLGIVVYALASTFDVLEGVVALSRRYEDWELDELIILSMFFTLELLVFSLRRWKEVGAARAARLYPGFADADHHSSAPD